ncbi:hypothetical protein I7I48_10914 [Histoplasma ohiense]|nr:hypothetical protein I7I48_10914 [Histoplasma ohiense (nom. inval.)]
MYGGRLRHSKGTENRGRENMAPFLSFAKKCHLVAIEMYTGIFCPLGLLLFQNTHCRELISAHRHCIVTHNITTFFAMWFQGLFPAPPFFFYLF